MNIDHIDTTLEGMPCEVYFFETWTTYEHPVTPVRPLYLEQALLRPGYYRAWMCTEKEQNRFVLFESMDNQREPIATDVPDTADLSAYLPRQGTNPPAVERRLALPDTLALKEYIVSSSADKGRAFLIRQFVAYSYRYRYNSDGSLASATITNIDGKVTVLTP